MRRIMALSVLVFCISAAVGADSFVPFVIPAKTDKDSQIAAPAGEPIRTDAGRLVVRSGHFYRGDERVRLWGVNLSFGANFPKHEDARCVAERLAAGGVNAIRCHHMDTAHWPRGIWDSKDGKIISADALDRLDYFIDQLARRGIFVNINLHVGREHSRYLGLPKTNRGYDKISNIFTPALIDAQKKYARELLTHVNKYRKVRYADDPAVAIVEITNENSFFMWGSEDTLRTLPPYYGKILQAKFNKWLSDRYGSDDKLRDVWAEGVQRLGDNLLTNADFQEMLPGSNAPAGWHLEQHAGCKVSVSRRQHQSRDGLRIEISKADETEWHLQLSQPDMSIKAGQYYTVLFEAASEQPRYVGSSVGQAHSPWKNLGLSQRVELTSKWQKFRYGFVARADDNNARLSFAFGASSTPLYLANVELRPGGRVGLAQSESIEAGSVELFASSESPARTLDRMCFLAQAEKAYFDDMRNFINNELPCKALVTGTIVFGPMGLYAQSDMDFIDAHAYWQHPRFPARPWDRNNWIVEQKAMTDYPAEATLFRLAAERLAGKPFTVSEYNHPAPLDCQAECVPMIASFAAAQDWDGVWLYTYSHSSDAWYREHLNSYFDIDTNPGKWGFMRAGAAILRDAGIAPLTKRAAVLLASPPDTVKSLARLHLEHDQDMFGAIAELTDIDRQKMLERQYIATLSLGRQIQDLRGREPYLKWSVKDGKGFYAASGQGVRVYIGHAEMFQEGTKGKISISSPAFVVMTITSLDGAGFADSQRILLTACGRCENTGMRFSEDRQTVGANWGGPPAQIQPVEGILVLPAGNWIPICYALGPDGMPSDEVHVQREDGKDIIELSTKYKTMWYLLTRTTK
jgi:hypothetical protein